MQLVFKLPWDLLAHEVDLLEIVVAQPSVVLVAEQPRRAADDAGQVDITGDRLAVTPLLVA